MTVMSIRIDEKRKKALKIISSLEGKTISSTVSDMIDDYLAKNKKKIMKIAEKEIIYGAMKLSEEAFSEWDSDEDEVYNE